MACPWRLAPTLLVIARDTCESMVRVIGVVGLRFGVWRPLGPLPVYRAPYKYPVAEACFLHLYTVCGTKIDPLTQSRVFVKLRSGRVTCCGLVNGLAAADPLQHKPPHRLQCPTGPAARLPPSAVRFVQDHRRLGVKCCSMRTKPQAARVLTAW